MFDELNKYKVNDHFFCSVDDLLAEVCNAPKTSVGVYYVLALAHGKIELVYIGSSGKMKSDGSIKARTGGLYDRIVNGTQFGGKRNDSWIKQMKGEDIDALDVYWFETFNDQVMDIPMYVEAMLMQIHFDLYAQLPRWNLEF